MTAARLKFRWLGVRKTLTPEQKSQAADPFEAESKYLYASKKLIDTTHPSFQAVTAIKTRASAFWKGVSLPYPEPGLRLIKHEAIGEFDRRMTVFQEELQAAVGELDRQYAELKDAASNRLGRLFNPSDYPASLLEAFEIAYDFPHRAARLPAAAPGLRVGVPPGPRPVRRSGRSGRGSVPRRAGQAGRSPSQPPSRLAGADDGRAKRLHDSAVTNLREFFDRFESLRIGSSQQLSELVSQARSAVNGVDPGVLRLNGLARQQVASQMAAVQSRLDQLMVDRPRRNIQRRPK